MRALQYRTLGAAPEVAEVVEIPVEVETFSLSDAPVAYERLRAGTIRGRAVIVPKRQEPGR